MSLTLLTASWLTRASISQHPDAALIERLATAREDGDNQAMPAEQTNSTSAKIKNLRQGIAGGFGGINLEDVISFVSWFEWGRQTI
jgi:hypothetical protein